MKNSQYNCFLIIQLGLYVITYQDFCRAIRDFQDKYGPLDTVDSSSRHSYEKNLLKDPIIHAYLTRQHEEIEFQDDHPVIGKEELNLYREFHIPCREETISHSILSPKFYTKGISNFEKPLDIWGNIENIEIQFSTMHLQEVKRALVVKQLKAIIGLESNPLCRFRLFGAGKSGHQYTIIQIIDPIIQSNLLNIVLNSADAVCPQIESIVEYDLRNLLYKNHTIGSEVIDPDLELAHSMETYCQDNFGIHVKNSPSGDYKSGLQFDPQQRMAICSETQIISETIPNGTRGLWAPS